MILPIDVGNTNIVLGMIENGEIQNVVRIHTDLRETGTEYALKLRQVADFYHIDLMGLEGYHFLGRASGHGVTAAGGGEPYPAKSR
ncbi:MAG: type III pantothenate kinase [Oscillospiraceae bacterium]